MGGSVIRATVVSLAWGALFLVVIVAGSTLPIL